MIFAIAAVDNNWGIGYDGELLERIPADMKYFRELTTNNAVIMGSKTWASLSGPLPDRLNFIISSKLYQPEGAYVMSMETAKRDLEAIYNHQVWTDKDIFIIGGGQVYEALLPYCDMIYITKIFKDHENVDTYFPNLDMSKEWKITSCSELREYEGISYAFLTYERV